jgi:dCMP deaminase
MSRPSKDEYYLGIAAKVAARSTCLRRQYGAVIVKDDVIVSTGYNGAARGEPNCSDNGECWRQQNGIPHGERYEFCKAVHAEANAIINGNRADMIGATLYLAGYEDGKPMNKPAPCVMCARMIMNARIERVVTDSGGGK